MHRRNVRGYSMRHIAIGLIALTSVAAPSAASAATVIIYTDPMSLSRYTVVYDTPGRDRAYVCMLPPRYGSCHAITLNRKP
jgi:hypothetical protein